ncbi:MAG TPA: hypothetical protein VK826_11210, partial [Bacteroidia bacterium]|nr:hypothetical protein [Bacteroidia bacterium]
MGREYIFDYMGNKSSVTLDGYNVLCKLGPFRKRNFLFANIKYYYLQKAANYQTLFIIYTDDLGKDKRVQFPAHPGEQGLHDLVNELFAQIPTKTLNNLSEKEAFKTMKTANPKKWAAVIAFLVMFVVITVFFIPGLTHYFDHGLEDAEVQELIDGKDFGTRNLNLSGVTLDQTLEETTTTSKSGSTTTKVEYFIPIVPPDWDDRQSVQVIMEFGELSDEEYYAILESSEFVGTVRDVWYEGLDDDQIQFFRDEYGLTVNDDAILFEVTGTNRNDQMLFWIWIGATGIFLIIFVIAYLKQK